MSEDSHMRNATPGNGRSLNQISVWCVGLFLVFLANKKVKRAFDTNQHQKKDSFQARSSIKFDESLSIILQLIRQMKDSPSLILEET